MSHLTIGDDVPSFEEKDEQGTVVSSTLLLGKKYILFCYPKDDTPGCTAENCSLRDHYATLKDMGYLIYGVSPDNEKKHLKFKDIFLQTQKMNIQASVNELQNLNIELKRIKNNDPNSCSFARYRTCLVQAEKN